MVVYITTIFICYCCLPDYTKAAGRLYMPNNFSATQSTNGSTEIVIDQKQQMQ